MADPKGTQPPSSQWPVNPAGTAAPDPKKGPAAAAKPQQPSAAPEAGGSGRVVHDSRGNAVWDWVKETGRICIESTSAMLKKLEVPGLKMEGEKDDELSIEADRDPGGGYDPYNQRTPVPKVTPTPAAKGKPPGRK